MERKKIIIGVIISIIVACVIPLAIFYVIEHVEDKKEKLCKEIDPKEKISLEDCINAINESRDGWGYAIIEEIRDQKRDKYYKEHGPLNWICDNFAEAVEVDRYDCVKYLEKNPGSTGQEVLDGIEKDRENYINRLLTKPLN